MLAPDAELSRDELPVATYECKVILMNWALW